MVAGLVVWLLIVTNIITILYIFKLKDRPLTKYDVLNWLGGKNSADRDGMLNDIVDCIYGGQKSIGFKPYKLNPKRIVTGQTIVPNTHTAAMAGFPKESPWPNPPLPNGERP